MQASPEFLARLQMIAEAENLAPEIDDAILGDLGQKVLRHFDIDKASMSDWEEKMGSALDLAMLVKEDKDYPWERAANIKYPLITSAALQYNARAYPAIVPSTDVVKSAVHGRDPDGMKARRAERVQTFMSWQLKVDSREWERGTDQLLLQLPICGDVFRKLWWDPAEGRLRSQVRLPGKHIVVNNNCTTLGTAPRVSDQISLYRHQIETNFRTGRFMEIDIPEKPEEDTDPEEFIEQLCRCDLDRDDYPEPYIVTVHKETQKVVRIVAAFSMDTIRVYGDQIIAAEVDGYLTHYQFMPSMDGGFFGTGMGMLLGDISETVNTSLNMIFDAAHLNSLGAGFIGTQDFRIKGGVKRMRPGEYKMVNHTGDDIRKGIVPLQLPGADPTLFQVLGMLIDAGREIASVSDVMTGDTAQANLPVGTVMALIEQGHMVFTASYKRIYRALMDEFELIAALNVKYLDPRKYMMMLDGEEPADPRADFNLSDMDVQPVADPKAVTSMQKMGRAQFLLEMANMGRVDPGEATMRVLEAASIENIKDLLPKPDPTAELMAQAQQELLVIEIRTKEAELDDIYADTMRKIAAAEKDSAEADLAPLKARVEQFRAMKEMLNERRQSLEAGGVGGMAIPPGNRVDTGPYGAGGGGQSVGLAAAALGEGGM